MYTYAILSQSCCVLYIPYVYSYSAFTHVFDTERNTFNKYGTCSLVLMMEGFKAGAVFIGCCCTCVWSWIFLLFLEECLS